MSTQSSLTWKQALPLFLLLAQLCTAFTAGSHRYTPSWDSRAALHLSTRPKYNDSASWSSGNFSLGRRQDGGLDETLPPEMDDYCVWRCSIATCGCDLTSSVTAVARRWDSELLISQSMTASTGPLGRWNNSALVDYRSLDPRGSRLEARFEEEPDASGRFTRARLDEYLPKHAAEADPWFTTRNSLTVGNDPTPPIKLMSTVAVQMDFSGRETIEIGTNGLHGCTVVTLVSKRGVWMAHFWQGYAIDASKGKINDNPSTATFQKRVLNFLSNTGEQDESNVGPSPDWSLFNKAGDNTQLIIHTPGNTKYTGAEPMTDDYTQYPKKVKAMSDIVLANIPGAQSLVHLYKPLDYTYIVEADNRGRYTGPDAERVDTTARGFCIFQWDGSAKERRWRLFAEYDMFTSQGMSPAS